MLDQLSRVLDAAGKPVVVLTGAGGSRVLVLPHGGRVLGLFSAGSEDNFLWTNPVLRDAESARAFFASEVWCNTGGDRTWLAPENDFFCPDYPKSAPYVQPRQLDPGRYRCERTADGVRLVCDLELHSYRTREDLRLRIVKQIEPAANPFHHVPDLRRLAALPFAGYTLRSTLDARGKANRTVAGLWHLLQMPHGGRMLIPTRFRVNPTIYFGSFSKRDLAVGDRMIRYAMRSPGEHKIGVRAVALTGRAGYLYPCPTGWALIVRNFHVNPSGSYVDALPNAGPCPADAFQACNVSNEPLGHFSELEYHVPAIGGRTGQTRCEDVSQVWAFRGPLKTIRRVADCLLCQSAADANAWATKQGPGGRR
jgi:hypothetical protein